MCAILALASCKTSQVVPLVLRDSVSITYKQGIEQPASIDARGAQTDLRKNSSAPALGKVGLGATPGASVFEEVLSERTKNSAVLIRVDTIVVERWHTQQVPAPDKPIPRFYKDCTTGFWILLLLLFGSIGLRILRAVAFRK